MKKLTEAGNIKRKTDPSDSRSYRLFLTESGIRIGQELGRLGRDHETMLTEGFSNGERDHLFSLLQKAAKMPEESMIDNDVSWLMSYGPLQATGPCARQTPV